MAHDFSSENIAQGAEQAVIPRAAATRAERGAGEALGEARLRALAALPGQIVWRADGDGLIKDDVPAWCAVTGQTPDAARGWGWAEAVHPEDRERAVAAWSAALARPGPFEQAARIRRADGQYRHFITRAAPVEVDGAVCEWIGVSTDVTEQAEAQASALALEQANRRMDEFLSIASHELRTPLTIFKANLQIVQRRLQRLAAELGGDGPLGARLASLEDLLARAEMASGRQERLVNDLLDVSRIQTGKLELRLEGCDLAAIVREGVEDQRLANPERAILLEGAEALVPAEVDADRIGQVVTNYLTNALKYSATDRLVMVTLRREPAWVRVAVHDEGPGLPAEEREQVWERFHRVAGVEHLNGSGVGLGLGLYICREIVERHGGQVGVESAMGAGSTFWFTLPLRPDADLKM